MSKKPNAAAKADGSIRWRIALAGSDFQCLSFFRDKYAFGSDVNGIRWSLKNQQERDESKKETWENLSQSSVRTIHDSVTGMHARAKQYGPEENNLTDWSCWLSDADRIRIESIQKKHDFRHKIEAIRFAIRCQATHEGFHPKGGW